MSSYYFTGQVIKHEVTELVDSYDLDYKSRELASVWLMYNVKRYTYRHIGEHLGFATSTAFERLMASEKLRLEDFKFRTYTSEIRDKLNKSKEAY